MKYNVILATGNSYRYHKTKKYYDNASISISGCIKLACTWSKEFAKY